MKNKKALAFTEYGITALSGVLKSFKAVEINVEKSGVENVIPSKKHLADSLDRVMKTMKISVMKMREKKK